MRDALDVHVDLKQVASQLRGTDRKFAAAIRREIRNTLSQSGSELVTQVRQNASWSSRIPSATSVKTAFSATRGRAEIVVDSKRAPHARPLEMGSKGSGGAFVRHPVFDSDKPATRWATMPTRPFFQPAVDHLAPVVSRRMEEDLDKIARAAGFD